MITFYYEYLEQLVQKGARGKYIIISVEDSSQRLPVFEYDRHDMRVSVKRDAVHRQRRQQREVA